MEPINEKEFSDGIKRKANDLGFNICGIAKARPLAEYGPKLKSWIEAGMNDIMGYLARDTETRLNPEYLLTDAKSLIVTGLSYFSEIMQQDPGAPLLSRYTYGRDYHVVIAEKLDRLLVWIKTIFPEAEGRSVVDSSPILEKVWGKEAGIGWQGRHSILINKDIGSFFFIGILILNVGLEYDSPFTDDKCGDCRICIEACPTGAINENRTIDARKCIANLTIENRGAIPPGIIPYLGRRVYGCDRCQEVCPWNKRATPVKTPEFQIDREIAELDSEGWRNLSQAQFSRMFKSTSMSRVKYEKILNNIEAAFKSVT